MRVIRSLPDMGDTAAVIASWPAARPLCALVSCRSPDTERSRWSILAAPAAGARDVIDFAGQRDVRAALQRAAAPDHRAARTLPFCGGWVGWLGYELGVDFEPTARWTLKDAPPREGRGWLARSDAALVRDEARGEWFGVGASDGAVDALLDELRAGVRAPAPSCEVGAFASVQGRGHYEAAVARAVEYIQAGDVFQANVAHELRASFRGSARGAFLRMLGAARPAFGALLEPPDGVGDGRAVCSISPELFLDADFASGRVATRPIKGTRPGGAAFERDLARSAKDGAELAMIVDLMRNDLSRVCEPGSVVVEDERAIERHGGGGVAHAVATVAGAIRRDAAFANLVEATFPPGSVTGAPKVRAMQIIDELEPFARGAYCGAIGFMSDCGLARLSVAIRTATIDAARGEIVYPVGAGIVAESDPATEWDETLTKAEAITRAFAGGSAS